MLSGNREPTKKELDHLKNYNLVSMGRPFHSWVFQNLKTGKLYDLSAADLNQIAWILEQDLFLLGKDSLYFHSDYDK